MKKLLASLVLASVMVGGACADDTWPVDLSFLDLIAAPANVAGVRVAIPYGANKTVTGFDIGLWGNADRAWAVQIDVLGNVVRDEMGGAQVGIYNVANHLTGIQFGVYNAAPTVDGAQVGIWNQAERVTGVQFGVVNNAEQMQGIQFGFFNYVPTFSGFQFGLVNYSYKVESAQIGLINSTEEMHGFQLGLVNVIHDSSVPFCVFANFHF